VSNTLTKEPTPFYFSSNNYPSSAYGEVYTARHVKRDEQVAIKVMHVKNPRDMKHICNEIYLLKSCTHPNIVNYLESYYYDYTVWVSDKSSFFILLLFANQTTVDGNEIL